jgi:hypothetical protein
MKTATAGVTARHTHLVRAAQCAGEAFAYSPADERRGGRRRPMQSLAALLGIGAFAALALFVAF